MAKSQQVRAHSIKSLTQSLAMVFLTVATMFASQPAQAWLPSYCQDIFETIPESRVLLNNTPVKATTFDAYRAERLAEILPSLSEQDRDRIYMGLVKDEQGLFGSTLWNLGVMSVTRRYNEASPDKDSFRPLSMRVETLKLMNAVRTKSGAEKTKAERELLEQEMWAARQLLSIMSDIYSKDYTLSREQMIEVRTRTGEVAWRRLNLQPSVDLQYGALFSWIAKNPDRIEFAELLVASVYHEFSTTLSAYSEKQISSARAARSKEARSKLNPLKYLTSRDDISKKLEAAETKIENEFSSDANRHTSNESRVAPSREPVPKGMSEDLTPAARQQVYSILYSNDGVFGRLAAAVRDPRNSQLRSLMTAAAKAQSYLDKASGTAIGIAIAQADQAKWEAGSELYRLIFAFLNPDPNKPYEFELKSYAPRRQAGMRQAINWINQNPSRVILAKKLLGEAMPVHVNELAKWEIQAFEATWSVHEYDGYRTMNINQTKGARLHKQLEEIEDRIERKYLVRRESIHLTDIKSEPSESRVERLDRKVARLSQYVNEEDRMRLFKFIFASPYGLGGELAGYLGSQPHGQFKLEGFHRASDRGSYDSSSEKAAAELFNLWAAAFFRKNKASTEEGGYVATGENRFTFVDDSGKSHDMPPFVTASRPAIANELQWILQDPKRVEAAHATIAAFFNSLGRIEHGGYYNMRLLAAFPKLYEQKAINHVRMGPTAAASFQAIQKTLFIDLRAKPGPKPVDTEDALIEMESDIARHRKKMTEKPSSTGVSAELSRRAGLRDLDVDLQARSETFVDYARSRMKVLASSFTPETKRHIFNFIIAHPSGFLGEFGVALSKMGRVGTVDGAFDLAEASAAMNQYAGHSSKARALFSKQLLTGEQILTLLIDMTAAQNSDFNTVINTQDVGYRTRMTSMKVHLPKKYLNAEELKLFRSNVNFLFSKPEYVEFAQLLLADAAASFARMPNAQAFAKPRMFGRLTAAGRAATSIRELKARMENDYLIATAEPQVKFAETKAAGVKFVSLPSLPPMQYEPETDHLKVDVAPLMTHLADDFSIMVSGHTLHHMERWSNNQLDILDIVLERYKTLETRLFDLRDLSANHFDSLAKPIEIRAAGTASAARSGNGPAVRLRTEDTMAGLRDHAKGVIDLKADAEAMRAYITSVLKMLEPMSVSLRNEAAKDPSFAPVSKRFDDSVASVQSYLAVTDSRLKSLSDAITTSYREVKEAVTTSSDHVESDNRVAAERLRKAATALRAAK